MPAENDLKGLIKRYIDNGISRRQFLTTLSAIGLSASATNTVAKEFAPFVSRKDDSKPLPAWARRVSGTGGKLLVEPTSKPVPKRPGPDADVLGVVPDRYGRKAVVVTVVPQLHDLADLDELIALRRFGVGRRQCLDVLGISHWRVPGGPARCRRRC